MFWHFDPNRLPTINRVTVLTGRSNPLTVHFHIEPGQGAEGFDMFGLGSLDLFLIPDVFRACHRTLRFP
ncbi:hypothetical protein BH18ACT5_BH18ACT5_06170 [soil metagenome]